MSVMYENAEGDGAVDRLLMGWRWVEVTRRFGIL